MTDIDRHDTDPAPPSFPHGAVSLRHPPGTVITLSPGGVAWVGGPTVKGTKAIMCEPEFSGTDRVVFRQMEDTTTSLSLEIKSGGVLFHMQPGCPCYAVVERDDRGRYYMASFGGGTIAGQGTVDRLERIQNGTEPGFFCGVTPLGGSL
jgi:hypothetical protein